MNFWLRCFIVLLGVSHFLNPAQARIQNELKPYYSREFYRAVESGAQDQELKEILHYILSQTHTHGSDGFDRVGSGCQSKCYQHRSIGYDRARVFLMGYFYLDQKNGEYGVREVYCEKRVTEREFKSKKPGPNRIPDNRVVNAEHTWPQSRFTGKFPKDMQKSDLHHLFPTDTQMNSARSNFPFGEVVRDSQDLKCPGSRVGSIMESRGTYFEPPENHKGNVARALFYFSVRYKMPIDPIQEKYLRVWHFQDIPDDEEIRRNQEIFEAQGNRNPFIDHPELVDSIGDF